jgi:hypothetical protein
MAATVLIRRLTGAGPTLTDITSINTRANAEDAHSTAGTTNSVLIPAAGSNYSYWVATRLDVTAITAGTVNNIKWYTDGSNNFGTGVTAIGNTATAYTQATGTAGTTGIVLSVGNYATVTTPVDPFSFTSGSPKSVTGTTSSVSAVFADLFVYQLVVGTTAASGASAQETFTWQYDDTSS